MISLPRMNSETSTAKRSNYLISNEILQIPDFMLHVGRPAKPWSQAPACGREAAERKEGSWDERRSPGQWNIMLLFIRSRLRTWMNMSTYSLTKSRAPRPRRRRSGFTFFFCSFWSEKYSQKIVSDHFVQEKFDSFIERQLLSPSWGTVNIKQSKFCLLLADYF